MSTFRVIAPNLLLSILAALLLAGCGGSGTSNAPPAAEQTGDTTQFANPQLLASARTLDTVGVIILDARHSQSDYNAGHIPGAIFAPPYYFSLDAQGDVLLPVAQLEAKLGEMGITRTSKIVIYDNTTASLGSGGRLFWMLEYLGCTDVSILNGGWDQWVAQLRTVQTEVPPPLPATTFTALVRAEISVTKEEVNTLRLGADPPLIVDARSTGEYNGSELIEASRPGHIPGAINIPYTSCYNPDKSVLNYTDLKQLLANHGITQNTKVVAYSTVGKRSAFFYFLARLLGYTNVVNYPGSIVEWSNSDPAQYPMETN